MLDILEKAKLCKAKFYTRDESFKPFAGQTMAMIFTKPSARTRVSFETVRDLLCFVEWALHHVVTIRHHMSPTLPMPFFNKYRRFALL